MCFFMCFYTFLHSVLCCSCHSDIHLPSTCSPFMQTSKPAVHSILTDLIVVLEASTNATRNLITLRKNINTDGFRTSKQQRMDEYELEVARKRLGKAKHDIVITYNELVWKCDASMQTRIRAWIEHYANLNKQIKSH